MHSLTLPPELIKKKIEENLKECNVGLEPTSVCFTDKLLTNNEVTLFIAIYFLFSCRRGIRTLEAKAVDYETTEIPTSHTLQCLY